MIQLFTQIRKYWLFVIKKKKLLYLKMIPILTKQFISLDHKTVYH